MEMPTEYMDPFELLMSTADSVITMVYINSLRGRTLDIFANYKDNSLTNKTAGQEILTIVKDGTKECLLQLSKKYMKKVLEHLSPDGTVLYISTHLKQLIENELRSMVNSVESGAK